MLTHPEPQAPKNGKISEEHWGTDRACGPRPPLPNVTFWTYKKTSCLTCLPAAKAHTRRARHAETAGPWGTDRACGPRPPLPNVTFWTYKKTIAVWPVFQSPRLAHGALATPKQQHPEGRTGPAGHGPHCLTSLSEPTRKLAVWPVFQPPRLTHGALATPKQQGPEGRTGPAGHGRQCLTSLSEPTRKLASCLSCKQHGPEGRTGPAGNGPPVPNVTFWTYNKTSCLTCLPALKDKAEAKTTKQQASSNVFSDALPLAVDGVGGFSS